MRTGVFAGLSCLLSLAMIAQEKEPKPPAKPEGNAIVAHWNHLQQGAEADAARISSPAGFHVNVFADHLEHARMLHVLDDGTVLLSRPKLNDVVSLRDTDGDGTADALGTVATGIAMAHGLATHGNTLYVAGETEIYSIERAADRWDKPIRIVGDLPTGAQHPNRTIAIGPDGKLYVSIGSTCNDCKETNPEAGTMLQLDRDGTNRRIFARGLRNTLGFDWHPETQALWGLDHGVDWRGENLPPEELNRLVDGGHFGWPLCFGKQVVDRTQRDPDGLTKDEVCASSRPSALELPAHSAPIGFTFYRGTQFPAEYRGGAFAALRGSWNRQTAREPKIVHIKFRGGKPVGHEDFVTGFMMQDGKTHRGRLAGVAVARDGALLFTDDVNGLVYRVSFGTSPVGTSARSLPPVKRPILSRVFKAADFRTPESVLHDEQQDVYFVSNIDGEPLVKDGRGFISKLSADGRVLAMTFIDGLHAPKGMAIRGRELWVADIDAMRSFDRMTGQPIATIDLAPKGAVFLNDVATGGDDAVYVTDMAVQMDAENGRRRTGTDRIFRIDAGGQAAVALDGVNMHAPNGIVWDGRRFVVGQYFGDELMAWTPGGKPQNLGQRVRALDGIVSLGDDMYLASSHYDMAIHLVRGHEVTTLFARPPTPADIGYDRTRHVLLIPSLEGGWVEAWKLPDLK